MLAFGGAAPRPRTLEFESNAPFGQNWMSLVRMCRRGALSKSRHRPFPSTLQTRPIGTRCESILCDLDFESEGPSATSLQEDVVVFARRSCPTHATHPRVLCALSAPRGSSRHRMSQEVVRSFPEWQYGRSHVVRKKGRCSSVT